MAGHRLRSERNLLRMRWRFNVYFLASQRAAKNKCVEIFDPA